MRRGREKRRSRADAHAGRDTPMLMLDHSHGGPHRPMCAAQRPELPIAWCTAAHRARPLLTEFRGSPALRAAPAPLGTYVTTPTSGAQVTRAYPHPSSHLVTVTVVITGRISLLAPR